MIITRKQLAQKLMDYLLHRTTFNDLVDWAELVMMDAEFEEQHFELIREIISRLGVGDVRSFGMTYEDYEEFLSKLGYRIHFTFAEKEKKMPWKSEHGQHSIINELPRMPNYEINQIANTTAW